MLIFLISTTLLEISCSRKTEDAIYLIISAYFTGFRHARVIYFQKMRNDLNLLKNAIFWKIRPFLSQTPGELGTRGQIQKDQFLVKPIFTGCSLWEMVSFKGNAFERMISQSFAFNIPRSQEAQPSSSPALRKNWPLEYSSRALSCV